MHLSNLIPSLIPLFLLPTALHAAEFALQISPSPALPNPFSLPPSTHATLSSLSLPLHTARLTPSNTLVFRNVSQGSYLIDIHSPTHAFLPLRVDVTSDLDVNGVRKETITAWETYRGNDWDNRGERAPVLAQDGSAGRRTFEVKAVLLKNHFMERQKFSVLSILKNPMILIALVSVGLFMGMPYLMNNMDPEMRAEFEEAQKSNPMNSILGGGGGGQGGFDVASYLSGSAPAGSSGNGGNGGNGGKGEKKGKNKGVTR